MEKQCGMRENSWTEKKFRLEWISEKCYIFNKSKIGKGYLNKDIWGTKHIASDKKAG